MNISVTSCNENFSNAWDAFLAGREGATFYHLYRWKEVTEKCFGHECHYLAAVCSGEIVGVLPLVTVKSIFFGSILCSLPFVNFGGICSVSGDAESLLLREAKDIVDKEGIGYLELRSTRRTSESLPTSEHKVSMTLALDGDPENIWNSFKTKQRTEIRRAFKNGLQVISGGAELLDTFFSILAVSWQSLGTPIYRKNYFKAILESFPDNTRIFVVNHEDTPVAAAFNGYYNGIVEGMWLGMLPRFRQLQPNSVLYWEMIKHACENNMKQFHFGRSSVDSGGEFFKKKWQATPKQLYWQYYLGTANKTPQLNVSNPKYGLAIKAWKKLPLELTKVLGPYIAAGIP
ncbi:MAG: FemAB family PEP-CTERM system-associated protein [Desulfofustis sp.]|nr:FemAB family PEP-CTERM system-associated protein [Desulfofustis sp.]